MTRAYLDSSAFVKLVVAEAESAPLRAWLRGRSWTSAGLIRAEALRVLRPHGQQAVEAGRRMLGRQDLIRLTPALLDLSARLGPPELRTLDAIHLAAASALRDELTVLVTYDHRLADAAMDLRMAVMAPR
jgi:predicted nucleic acid-binding protein